MKTKTRCDFCKHEIIVDSEYVSGMLHSSGYETVVLCEHCIGDNPSPSEETGIIVGVRI